MNLSDLRNVQLLNDNLKMFNQGWEEILLELDEHVLENLNERHVKKSTLMKHAMILYQQDTCSEKGAEKRPNREGSGH